jgi:formylglycine-generating enzyme required for sulfatase activity
MSSGLDLSHRRAAFLGGFAIAFVFGFITASPAPAENEPAGRKLAFLVGVKTYEHADLRDLDFPENDVEELAAVLKNDGFEIVVLTTTRGKTDARSKPTAENLRKRLKLLLQGVTKRDLLIVGLAGHGIQPLSSDDSYFCPSDANPVVRNDKPVAPERLVSVGEILAQVSDSGIGHKLLMVDACRNDPSARSAKHRGVDHVNVSALPSQTGVLLSCSQGEFSFESKSLGSGHGVFFYHVIEGLKGAAKDNDGLVTWDGLGLYVRTKVPATVEHLFAKDGAEQRPNAIGNLLGVPAVLARITDRPGTNPTPSHPEGPTLLHAPFSPEQAHAAQKAWAESLGSGAEMTVQRLKLEMVLIPPGEFQMGSLDDAAALLRRFPYATQRLNDGEWPVHPVRITKPFYMGKYSVTLRQFLRFYRDAGYRCECEVDGKGGWGWTGNGYEQRTSFVPWSWGFTEQTMEHPVVNVTWNDATAFCEWLSKNEGKKYRLPTEAEWEYACRAGTTSRYWFGDDGEDLVRYDNVADQSNKKNFPHPENVVLQVVENGTWKNTTTHFPFLADSDGYAFTAPVGSFKPNAFGLYDLHGNAAQWCGDWYAKDYYQVSPVDDPPGPVDGTARVYRGGGWRTIAVYSRAAFRHHFKPADRNDYVGFRVVRER